MTTKPKGPGRPPSKSRCAVTEMFEKLNYDPITELVRIATNPQTDEQTAVGIHKELAQYRYAKKKQITHDHGASTAGDLAEIINSIGAKKRPKPPVEPVEEKVKDDPEDDPSEGN